MGTLPVMVAAREEAARQLQCAAMLRRAHEELRSMAKDFPTMAGQRMTDLISEINDVLLQASLLEPAEPVGELGQSPFISNLAKDYPSLTPTELRMATFLRIPLPSKEIAALFHCSVRSVEKHRERMRRKFRLKQGENLTTFLASRIA